MSGIHCVPYKSPALLEFRGPDAVRFLNGQVTQDVRLLAGRDVSLPACITDAKGRLQFRAWLTASDDGALWVEAPEGSTEALEARLTRYLIADDVEVVDLTGRFSLIHFTGPMPAPPAGVMARRSKRLGVEGTDWWMPAGSDMDFPEDTELLAGEELEAFRIALGVPAWGHELTEGLLPPEAGLDATDISYQKGCYIGQEVISRIKSAGKVNQRLVRFAIDGSLPLDGAGLVDLSGNPAGRLTSVSPLAADGWRRAMAYVKRGVGEFAVRTGDGATHPVKMI